MRVLMRVEVPTTEGNRGLQSGKWQKVTTDFKQAFSPESMYFVIENGLRTVYVVVSIDKVNAIPALVEPWFQGLHARVELLPCLTYDEMDAAGPEIAMAIGNYADRYIRGNKTD
jgi:hypothetical protein